MDVRTLMTPDPVVCPQDTGLQEVARLMRDRQIGDVIVSDDSGPCGIVTDRDLVVRAIAEGLDPDRAVVGDICTRELRTVDADASVEELIALMESHALRRVPVVSGGEAVGIVSLGDLATRLDPSSLLGEISAAPPDRP